MRFVLDQYIEFPVMWRAPAVSRLMGTELKGTKLSSILAFNRYTPHFALYVMGLKSPSTVDCAVRVNIFAPKLIGAPPRKNE